MLEVPPTSVTNTEKNRIVELQVVVLEPLVTATPVE
jgi:hypothetical protein